MIFKKIKLAIVVVFLAFGFVALKSYNTTDNRAIYAKSITAEDLKVLLNKIASDEMEGRETGSEGQKRAAKYIMEQYRSNNITFPKTLASYSQKVPASFMNKKGGNLNDSENILAFIEGTEKPDEIIVVSAHYDHIGIVDGKICNGADDNGSGTVALLEIAKAFSIAIKNGNAPKRSILFLHFTGEEHGLYGSNYYSQNPVFTLANTVADLNIDMIGRRDELHPNTNNYVYLIGSNRLSTDLHNICVKMNKDYTSLDLDFRYNAPNDPNRFYERSDHYNFAKNGIPSVFFFNGVHPDYHQFTDKPDKVEYDALAKRTQLVFAVAWELANREKRIVVDIKTE